MRRLILITVAIAGLTGCEQALVTSIAGLSGVTISDTSNTNPLVITPPSINLTVGQTFQFMTNAPPTQLNEVQWSSLNTAVATTSPTGLVSAVGAGTTTITARFSFDTLNVATATVIVTGATGGSSPGSGGK